MINCMTDTSDMTGESNFKRPTRYDEVTFNGNKGEFFFRGKDTEKGDDGKYQKDSLGKEMSVVFLKIRRVLQAKYKPNTPTLRTSEHNRKGDAVTLFEGSKKIGNALADSILSKDKGLYTNQIVYCYLPEKKQVVRLIAKGSSLGSDKTAKGVMKFYDYMQSFEGDDHLHNFFTKLVPVGEEGPNGTYYAIDFQRGEKLNEAQQKLVDSLIREVHEAIQDNDKRFAVSAPDTSASLPEIQVDEEEEEESSGVKYPEEDINPEDIPF